MSPAFSIVVPTYERVALLRETVASALGQEGFDDYEVVVVDDGSADGTWEYLQGVRSPRLRAVRNERRLGMARNWNAAVRLSRGRFVFLLQDDDLAEPVLLARAAEVLGRHPGAELLCFATCLIDDDGRNPRLFWQPDGERRLAAPDALLHFARQWTLSSTQVVFARALFERHGPFDERPPIMSDAEAFLRWMVHADVVLCPEPLARRRCWAGSVSAATERSAAMRATMAFLVERVLAEARASGRLDAERLDELGDALHRSFIVPSALPAEGEAAGGPVRADASVLRRLARVIRRGLHRAGG